MAGSDATSTLRRKLLQSSVEDGSRERSALGALRLALARVSRETMGLRIDVIGATQSRLPQEDLAALLPSSHLLILLDGPGESSGAMALDPGVVAALTQQQTTGVVTVDPVTERAFTDTDAAMCAPLVQAMLAQAADLADRPEDSACLAGFSFGARAEDGQSLALGLAGSEFRVFELRLDVESGALQSALTLVLPDQTGGEARSSQPGSGRADGDAAAPASAPATLGDAALNAAVNLTAVLCRVRLGVDHLAKLKEGDVLPLGGYRIDRTELLSGSGQKVAAGRLGRVDGVRAIRVNETTAPDPAFSGVDLKDDAGLSKRTAAVAEPVVRVQEDEAELLNQMNPDEAMARISELAGLDLEAEATLAAPDDQ